MKIVTSQQMNGIEALCKSMGIPTNTLMEKAGIAVARRVRRHLGHISGQRIAILVGRGNNGGDGLVASRHLSRWGAKVTAYVCLDRKTPDLNLLSAIESGVRCIEASSDPDHYQLNEVLESTHIIVDAVLGTGISRPIAGQLKRVLEKISNSKPGLRVIAVDIPSGLDPNTGKADPVCISAEVTIALGYPKLGLYEASAHDKVGLVDIVDIGIPPGLDREVSITLMTSDKAKSMLPMRLLTAHKGDFGRTLIIAGSPNYIGAASLAATAAYRVGAGIVTLATPESLKLGLAAQVIEPVYLPLPESMPGELDPGASSSLVFKEIPKHNALLVGCGTGQSPAAKILCESILYSGKRLPPTIVDADGLNSLARNFRAKWWTVFPQLAIITPHPGEMSKLTEKSTDEIQNDRIGQATHWSKTWNKITVLKGAHTVVALPNGQVFLNPHINPGLASAGTGDVLAGIIAGLLSQGCPMGDAAALGVFLHGQAGDYLKSRLGNAGILASDLLPVLPMVINKLRTT